MRIELPAILAPERGAGRKWQIFPAEDVGKGAYLAFVFRFGFE
jgi:hypothetical protein